MKKILLFGALLMCIAGYLACRYSATQGCPYPKKVLDVPMGEGRLVIHDTCCDHEWLRGSRIRGNGMTAEFVGKNAAPVVVAVVSEASPPLEIDFSKAAQGEVSVLYFTVDQRARGLACFAEVTVTAKQDGSVSQKGVVLLKAERFNAEKAELLEKAIRWFDSNYEADDGGSCFDIEESAIGHLRNMGLDEPEKVLPIFARLMQDMNGHHTGEIIFDAVGDLEFAQRIRDNKLGMTD